MKKFAFLMAAAVLPLSLSAPAMASDDKVAEAPTVLPTPPAGKGLVVFYRPSSMGFAIKCTVRENGHMVGRVGAGRYYAIVAEPGLHSYTAKSEATDTVNVQVEPDEITYVKCKISMGVMVGRPNLSPSTKEEWDSSPKNLKPMESDKIAAEIAKDEAELAKKAGK